MPALSYIARIARRVAIGILATIAITLGVCTVLVGSQAGTRFLAERAEAWLGDDVRWDSIEGRLAGPLGVTGLTVAVPGTRLRIRHLELDWQPGALLNGEARVTRVFADGIEVTLAETESADEPAQAFDPESLALPVNVMLDALALRALTITQPDASVQRIDSIDLGARLVANALAVETLDIRTPEGGARISVETTLSRSMPVALEASWEWAVPATDTAAGSTAAAVPVASTPSRSQLRGAIRVQGSIEWAGNPRFALELANRIAGLEALEADLPDALQLEGRLAGEAGEDFVRIDSFALQVPDTQSQVNLRGNVTGLVDASPRADLTLTWLELQWPLQASAPLAETPRGEVTMRGSADAYTLEVSAAVRGTDIPAGDWQLSASGDAESLDLASLRGRVLGGLLEGRGRVSWTPIPAWDLELQGQGLDPGEVEAAAAGELAFNLVTEGSLDSDASPDAQVLLQELRGTVAGRPIAASAGARIAGDTLDLAELTVSSEDNAVRVSGTASEQDLNLQWTLDATNPGALLPGAAGRLGASGFVRGSVEAPDLEADLQGQDLRLEDLHLAEFAGHARVGLDPGAPLSLRLTAGELLSGEETLMESARITASGTLGSHTLALEGSTPAERLSLRANGSADLETATWRGTVEDLALATELFGAWELQAPAALAYGNDEASLSDSCLQQDDGPGVLCLAGELDNEGAATADLRVDALPLQAFVAELTGDLVGSGDLRLEADGELRADLSFALSSGEVLLPIDDGSGGEVQRLAHEGGSVEVHVDTDGLSTHLDFAAPESGTFNADVSLPGFNRLPLADDQRLDGRVTMAFPRLDLLAAWVEDVSEVGGRLEGDVRLGGTVAAPLLDGGVALRDGAAAIPVAGLRLSEVEVAVSGDPGTPGLLALSGGLRSGGGTATLAGTLDSRTTELDLSLQGERLTVFNTADARVYLSPDLAIAWSDDTLKLRGDLFVPEASITPQLQLRAAATADAAVVASAPGQVLAPSPDVIIINADPELTVANELEATAPFRIDSRIRLALGEAVQVRALGFKSRIDGAVTFINAPARDDLVPIADGSFNLRDGTFLAFGQDLEIETGQLIFARVPATEPELNVRAVRWIDNDPQVTAAGVLVTGPASQPVLELFSRPQLDVAEIQSYLLTGTSASERSNVLAIGTYLTPRVYVGYGYNVLESTSEFNSLFSITPTYGVSANAGDTDSNVNLTVTYER